MMSERNNIVYISHNLITFTQKKNVLFKTGFLCKSYSSRDTSNGDEISESLFFIDVRHLLVFQVFQKCSSKTCKCLF